RIARDWNVLIKKKRRCTELSSELFRLKNVSRPTPSLLTIFPQRRVKNRLSCVGGIMNIKKTILAGTFGNAVEWYDFTAYAFFAPVIAKIFFPTQDALASLLLTFGVFAAGFLVRPFGGFLFGYLGDHLGRKTTLIISICLISLPTFLLGLLP